MRCPNCEKFVSYDTDVEPEAASEPEMSGQTVTALFTRTLPCAECGTDLKGVDIEVEIHVPGGLVDCKDEDGHEWNVKDYSVEPTHKTITHKNDRLLNQRAWRTFYGVTLSVDLECEHCDTEVTVEGTAEEQASAFEEL